MYWFKHGTKYGKLFLIYFLTWSSIYYPVTGKQDMTKKENTSRATVDDPFTKTAEY